MNETILDTVGQVDRTLLFTSSVAIFFLVLIVIVMLYFIRRYHHSRNAGPADIRGNNMLEAVWIIVPTLIVLAMFYSGWQSYLSMRRVPGNAMAVSVTARKWSWTFTYDNGRISNILYVPQDRPVKLNISSVDVLHSFYAPAFRIKRDAVPGLNTYVWFLPEETGQFDIRCTEYCGTGHSAMLSRIAVLPPADFTEWYEKGGDREDNHGLEEYIKQGCIGCHLLGEAKGVGPGLAHLYASRRTVNTDVGVKEVTADDEYLKNSILNPGREIVKGYPPVMPSYTGKLSDMELEMLINFIKNLGEAE